MQLSTGVNIDEHLLQIPVFWVFCKETFAEKCLALVELTLISIPPSRQGRRTAGSGLLLFLVCLKWERQRRNDGDFQMHSHIAISEAFPITRWLKASSSPPAGRWASIWPRDNLFPYQLNISRTFQVWFFLFLAGKHALLFSAVSTMLHPCP